MKSEATTAPLPQAQEKLREACIDLARRAGARIIDPIPTLCPGGQCIAIVGGGRPVYKDESHLRPFFVKTVASFIDVALRFD